MAELERDFQMVIYTRFVFLFILSLLLSNTFSLSTEEKQLKSESLGTISHSSKLELFNGPHKFPPMRVEYLKAALLGETITLKNDEVTVYKWPLQYDNQNPMDDYHIYFFTGKPIDSNGKTWVKSNLEQVMNEFKQSKGQEYINLSFPSFFLNLKSSTIHPAHRPCINEFKALKQGEPIGPNLKLHAPFLFAFIRKQDNKIMFTQYIDDPLTEGKVCPFQGYSVSSKTGSIEAEDATMVSATNKGKEASSIYFLTSLLWNAVIQEIHYDPLSSIRHDLGFPYLRVFFRGKRLNHEKALILSWEAKSHLEMKWNRYVFFLLYPHLLQPLPKLNEFPFDSFSNLMQETNTRPIQQMRLQFPTYLMKVHPIHSEPYLDCLHSQKGIPSSMIEWNQTELVNLESFRDDLYFMIHDRIYNMTIATGQLIRPSNPNACRLY